MKLKAIHAIYTMGKNKKQIRIDPGSEFEIEDAEGEKLIASKAAAPVAVAAKAEAKAETKKAPAKKAPAQKAVANDAVTPGAVAGVEGGTGTDEGGEDLLG